MRSGRGWVPKSGEGKGGKLWDVSVWKMSTGVTHFSCTHACVCVCEVFAWTFFSVQAKTSSGPLFIKPNSVDGRAPIDSKLSIFGLFVGSLINTLHFLSHEYWFSISSFCNNGLNPILHTSGFCSTNNVRLVAPDLFLGGLFLVFYVYQILHTTIKPHLLGFTGFYFYKRGR